jgi:hypothetical protein
VGIQVCSYYFCLMIEESGSRRPKTYGSDGIRFCNTEKPIMKMLFFLVACTLTSTLATSAGPVSAIVAAAPPVSSVAAAGMGEGGTASAAGVMRSTRIRGPRLVVRFRSFFLRRLAAPRPSSSAVPVSLSVYPPQLLMRLEGRQCQCSMILLFTMMRIRILLATAMRIRIQPFTLMRIRILLATSIRIRILFTLMRIWGKAQNLEKVLK